MILAEQSILILLMVLAVALAILAKGADLLVDNAVILSRKWGISEMVIGGTIVALGTTLPELSASVIAATEGLGGFAVGNAIGSILTNTSLILGIGALFGSIPVTRNHSKKLSFLIAVLVFFFLVSLWPLWQDGEGRVLRVAGPILLLLLIPYFLLMLRSGRREQMAQMNVHDIQENLSPSEKTGQNTAVYVLLLKMLLALVLITLSAKLLVDSAEIIALRIGVSEVIIASTLVAFGTSVPEISTAVTAARSGHGGLVIGNVIGANILNVLLVLGASVSLSPNGIALPRDFYVIHMPSLTVVLLVYSFFAYNTNIHRLERKEGLVLAALYVFYLGVTLAFT